MRKATNKNWQRVTAAAAALALCAGVLTLSLIHILTLPTIA